MNELILVVMGNTRSFFSGETWVLNKLSELAARCGLSPTIANVCLTEYWSDDGKDHHYALSYVDGNARNEAEDRGVQKMVRLLGFDHNLVLEFPDLMKVEEAVDHALSLSPRARVRDR